MKHLLIVNKASGNNDKIDLLENIKDAFKNLDYEIYETTAPKSATKYLREYFKKETKETVRVYACGGDGTVFEVVNGIVGAKNAELAVYPCGTGNDFVKTFAKDKTYDGMVSGRSGEKRFLDFPALINASTKEIDLTKISSADIEEDIYSINVINFGFDAIVGAMGNFYKINGIPSDAKKAEKNDPYKYALNHDAMKHGRFNDTIVYADGEQLNEKQILLGTCSQGQFVGGSFWCAPKSDNTDGLIDVCVLKTMTFLGLGLIIGPYTHGKHLDKKRRKVVYRQAKSVKIVAPREIDVCVDGEMIKGKEFKLSICSKAMKIALPE